MMRQMYRLLLAVCCVWLTQCDFKSTRSVEYNNKIISIQKNINTGIDSFFKVLGSADSAAIVPAYDTLVKEVNVQINFARSLKPIGKDSSFKTTALELFEVYHRIIEVDYARMVPLLMQSGVTAEEKDLLVEMETKIKKDEKAAYQKFKKAQQVFAKRYGFKFE